MMGAIAMMRVLEEQLELKEQKPVEEAQQLFYDAMEALTEERQLELLRRALKLDAGNVDAWLGVLRHQPVAIVDQTELLKKIVELAARRLGGEVFKEFAGHFWGFMETRPYMRARYELAEKLLICGQMEAAIAEWEEMLELNPNDNQGVRYRLLGCYLEENRLESARELFKTYGECEHNTLFAWCRVLERWLSGDIEGAREALKVARKQNPHTEGYLKGRKRMPEKIPMGYTLGSKEEAICFAEGVQGPWGRHPEAMKWLEKEGKSAKKK